MKRRRFVHSVGKAFVASTVLPYIDIGNIENQNTSYKKLYQQFLKKNDESIPVRLKAQVKEEDHKWFGGIRDGWGIPTPGGATGLIQSLTCAYVSEESQYFESELLIRAMLDGAAYLLNVQHKDGTIDLHTTNFHSTPDTGFVVEPLALAYTVLTKQKDRKLNTLLADIRRFLINAGDALSVGGIHTPNHRWVVCSALARINTLFPNKKYTDRIETWLNEKIDIDPDGQYTEKSASIYSPIVNKSLITIARLTDQKELLDPVRKNLDMTLYYLHANGEVATESSIRRDRYYIGLPDRYYYSYRYMSIRDNDGVFSAMTHMIEDAYVERLTGNLIYFLEDPDLTSSLPPVKKMPDNYEKPFLHSNLVRIRRENVDATILAQNPTFFTFFNGNAALQSMRLATAFFGRGQFEGEKIEMVDGKYVLAWELSKGYYQPFPPDKIPDDGDWDKMPRGWRDPSEVQDMEVKIKVTENEGTFDIEISIMGTENVPLALELGFRKGGTLTGVKDHPKVENAYLLDRGMGTYSMENDNIQFGPGNVEHNWTQLRGALPKLDAECVYLTGFTPFHHTITIKKG